VALKGSLGDFGLPQLLNLVHLTHKTGALTIRVPAGVTTLFFREGNLIQATTGGRDGRLSSVLARAGKLTEKQAEIIRDKGGSQPDKELAMFLVKAGYVSHEEVVDSTRHDVLDTVYALFPWSDGVFHFEPNHLPVDGTITVVVGLENVILEGKRRIREWQRLQDELPDLGMALQFRDHPEARSRRINLSDDEWRVISYINPRNSMEQISHHLGLDDFQVRRIVYGLLQAGLVEMVAPERARVRRSPLPVEETVRSRPLAVKSPAIGQLLERIKGLERWRRS
jgi:DNA-binding MarR family transcriptional regulator